MDFRFEEGTKTVETSVVVVPHVRKRFVPSLRNVFEGQPVEEEHLNGLPLRVGKSGECFASQMNGLLHREMPWRPKPVLLLDRVQFDVVVKLSHEEVVSPVDRSAVCVLQEPHSKSSSCRVKLSHLLVNF